MKSIENLFNQLWDAPKDKFTWHSILSKSMENYKQDIIDNIKIPSAAMVEKKLNDRCQTSHNDAGFKDGVYWMIEIIQNQNKQDTKEVWCIYSDNCKWNEKIGNFDPCVIFSGNYGDALKFAQNKYGKFYTIHKCENHNSNPK